MKQPEAVERVAIFFHEFLKDSGGEVGGGGIGTEIAHLCPALSAAGYQITVFQCADAPFETRYGDATVIGVCAYPGNGRPTERVVREWRQAAGKRLAGKSCVELYMADFSTLPNRNPLAIAVQQGLSWDAPIELLTHKKVFRQRIGERVFRSSRQLRGLRRFENCFNRVAVDLFFLNWYRSFRGLRLSGRVWYNPNPAPDVGWDGRRDARPQDDVVRIICARRLVPEKGTQLVCDVFSELLKLRENVRITISGDGPERADVARRLGGNQRVTMNSYATRDAVGVHQNHEIAVIPSLCGEGTSLAIAEAMAAGCAVVATNTGGTITQIIDGYNGKLCWPEKRSLLDALLWLVDHPNQRVAMQRRAWEVATSAFGMRLWQERWLRIIRDVIDGREEAAFALRSQVGARP